MKFSILITFVFLIESISSFYILDDSFKNNENSSLIETLTIIYETTGSDGFPNIFTISLKELLNDDIQFVRIETHENDHPVQSDHVYTVDSNGKAVKVSLTSDQKNFEFYKEKNGNSIATLIKNSNPDKHSFRMLGTLHLKDSTDLIYNIIPLINRKETSKRKRSSTSYDSNKNAHFLIRRDFKEMNFDNIRSFYNNKVATQKASRVKRSNNGQPFNLFVELLIVTDLSIYNDHVRYAQTTNQDLVFLHMKAYFAHYVSTVNQRYQNSFTNDPDLRITVRLTNLLFLTSSAQCQWTNSSLVGVPAYPTYNGLEVVVTNPVLNNFTSYMESLKLNFTYDHAMGLFNKDLWSDGTGAPDQLSGTAGYASIGLVCTANRYSISEETGGFANVFVAAHELGHNLGAYHDGLSQFNGGDIYTSGCAASDNYIMTASLGSFPNNLVNNLKFSSCSIASIKNNILASGLTSVGQNFVCLTNIVNSEPTDYLTNNTLPGQFFTANDQCQMIYGSNGSFCQIYSSSMCTALSCRTTNSLATGSCISVPGRGATSGTQCASGKSCIQGVCTASSTAVVSDCPFGDDRITSAEINAYLSFLQLPQLQTAQTDCESVLAYYSSSGYSLNAFCTDTRTKQYFRGTCCSTCKKYDSLTCADTLYNCASYKASCSGSISFDGITNIQISTLCPRSCGTCSSVLNCANNLCKNGGICTTVTPGQYSLTGFICSCLNGFSGSLCENFNPCTVKPCQNNGVCERFGSLGYVCSCSNGFSGYNCSINNNLNPCSSGACSNGATCQVTGSSYTCLCVAGYSGTNCQIFNACYNSPCLNGATCQTGDLGSSYICICPQFYSGTNCQTYANTNGCSNSPCLNGATCQVTGSGSTYVCQCIVSYTGNNCQTFNACFNNPCLNGATCQSNGNSYLCVCRAFYSGTNCQTYSNACSINPCLNGGSCQVTGTGNSYVCSCPSGYSGSNCQIYNACFNNPCLNGAACQTSGSSYICLCPTFYSGTNCQTYSNACSNSPCLNGGTCQVTGTGSNGNSYICICPSFYSGSNCQTCNVTGTGSSYTCQCAAGYSGTNCQIFNACYNNPCSNGATCQNNGNSYICICPAGYSGATCQTYSNACSTGPCLNDGTCQVTGSGTTYTCSCRAGYSGANCQTYNPCFSNPCSNGASCQINGSGNIYICICPAGYSGATCQTYINVCSSNPCLNGAICTSTGNSYFCSCASGYSGTNCQIYNACFNNPCLNGATCQTSGNSFACICQQFYSGTNCQTYSNGCSNNPCLNGATCQTGGLGSSYICICPQFYSGTNCQTYANTNGCSNSPCLNGATCVPNGNSYICSCPQFYSGTNCQVNVCTPNPCLNEGNCSLISATLAKCACKSGYSGSVCQYKNPCYSNPCQNNGFCSYFNNQYTCSCVNNFSGLNCEINTLLVCTSTSCFNGGTCSINPLTSLTRCQCAPSYTGSRCEQLFNPCFDANNSPICLNSASCTINYSTAPYYQCSCRYGYSGLNCEIVATTTKFTVTTRLYAKCEDQNPFICQYYKSAKLCSNSYFINGETVNSYCPKSCQLCGSAATTTTACVDKNGNCPVWNTLGYCNRLPDPYICKKSCSLC